MHLNEALSLHCPDMFEKLDKTSTHLQKLQEPKFWSSLPLLNYTPLHLLKDLQLVRFRGMIQDMQDPEIYLKWYEVKNVSTDVKRPQNGKYRDSLHLKPNEEVVYESDINEQGERRTLFVVGIPGINKWASEYEENCNILNVPNISTQSKNNSNLKKRSAPSDCMDVDEEEVPTVSVAGLHNEVSNEMNNKRQCTGAEKEEITEPRSTLASEYLLNSPIPERPSKACMVKIYKDFDDYALNTVIDVIGFLSVDPALDGSNIDTEMYNVDGDSVNELHAQNPPPSLIPRLHAIAIQNLPHHNPLMDERFLSVAENNDVIGNTMNMLSIRKDLRMLLSLCFFNDNLAAEYMLSHLISTIHTRSELECLGKFTLNICNLPKEMPLNYTKKLYDVLEMLLPSSHYLPLTLETLNTAAFTPKKDYATSKLVSGMLQLAPHTHLILDETQLEQGKLENSGVLAVQNLAHLINSQQIRCNFQYYDIDYNVDIPVFVLSEGKSMLPNDFIVPLQNDDQSKEIMEETLKAARHYLQPDRLDRFRRYLTKAKITSYAMSPDDSEIIQEDFVEMRKAGKITSAEDLHALLVLTRLIGISSGKTVFDKESWELAKQFESERKQRIQNLPKAKTVV